MKYEIHFNYKCNQNCIFCSVLQHPQRDLELSDLDLILPFIHNNQIVQISGGEPLLNTNLIKWVKEIKKKTRFISLTTNGTLLNKDNLNELINLGVNCFIISLHSNTINNFKKITTTDNFNNVINCLELFKKINNSSIKVIVNTVITKYNISEIFDLFKMLHEKYGFAKIKLSYPRFYKFAKSDFNCKIHLLSLTDVHFFLKDIINKPYFDKLIIENIPSCIIKPSKEYRDWSTKLLTVDGIKDSVDNTRYYMKKCVTCNLRLNCQGFHKYYNYYFDDYILET
ncbi:MAG: radical SAM protein [Candidatus ainarchaeum sp.]|nr:radical SAM protein [Candidatus ainarchaeum sp.]MDD3976107.1 radical SAM protein [Candidatus ainarchaeum sp.]